MQGVDHRGDARAVAVTGGQLRGGGVAHVYALTRQIRNPSPEWDDRERARVEAAQCSEAWEVTDQEINAFRRARELSEGREDKNLDDDGEEVPTGVSRARERAREEHAQRRHRV